MVLKIRGNNLEKGETKRYGVGKGTIMDIHTEKTWRHIL